MSEPMIGEIKIVGFPWCPYGYAFANGATMQIQQNNALYALIGTYYGGDGRATFGLPNLQSRAPIGIYTGGGGSPFLHYQIANNGGSEAVSLTLAQLPVHNHATVVTQPAFVGSVSGAGTATGTATGTGNATGNIEIPANGSVGGANTPSPNRVLGVVSGGTTLYAGAAPTTTLEPFAVTLPVSVSVPISVPVSLSSAAVSISQSAQTTVTVANNGASSPFDNRSPFLAVNYIIATNGVFPQRN